MMGDLGFAHVVGVLQLGVLLGVYYRLGRVMQRLNDHGRRITRLEGRGAVT